MKYTLFTMTVKLIIAVSSETFNLPLSKHDFKTSTAVNISYDVKPKQVGAEVRHHDRRRDRKFEYCVISELRSNVSSNGTDSLDVY
jgi:hypothetical protein